MQENKRKTSLGRRLSDSDTPGNGVQQYFPEYRIPKTSAQTSSSLKKAQSLRPASRIPDSSSNSATGGPSSAHASRPEQSPPLKKTDSNRSTASIKKTDSLKSNASVRSTASTMTSETMSWDENENDASSKRKELKRVGSFGRHWKKHTQLTTEVCILFSFCWGG